MAEFVMDRVAIISALIERDGDRCMYPGCDKPFDDGAHEMTIDHIYPQSKAYADGWTYEQVNDISNLQLMGKRCNAVKGDLVYNPDGTLPEIPRRERAADKSSRAMVCNLCESGRLLFEGEQCELCGSGPQPASFPKYAQRAPKDCSHGWVDPADHCWMCVIGHVERKPAFQTAFDIG